MTNPSVSTVPAIRLRTLVDSPIARDGQYVLYWMVATRRAHWNYGLQRARDWASELGKPLLVLEPLRCDYRWASDRLHRFVIEGMAANARAFAGSDVRYFLYVEPQLGAGRDLIATLAARACVVVSDDFPAFFLPHMHAAAAKRIPIRYELVDSCGLLPMRAAEKVFLRAYDFRRFLQKNLRPHLEDPPEADPLADRQLPPKVPLPTEVAQRWPPANLDQLLGTKAGLSQLPIDHSVIAVDQVRGGADAAREAMNRFIEHRLQSYQHDRNEPLRRGTSQLSPYLHFGHVSAHEVFDRVTHHSASHVERPADERSEDSKGWWEVDPAAGEFLDQLVTWRELGLNFCSQRDDYDQYASLPDWAQKTLGEHATDQREHEYTCHEFEQAETHNELWNAAQRQLLREGAIHNYMRMVWGKKILEWSPTPQDALETMIELNNKYAFDGRDPNSYSGIFWCLGRYDRAWGPERPIFGKIRYMSTKNTARKLDVGGYLEEYGP